MFFAMAGGRVRAQPRTLTILHTNDMHAGFVPHEAYWIREANPKPMVGGFKELCYAIDSIRHVKPLTLLVDAGDVMTGTPIADIQYRGAVGGALFEMMDRIGYEAWCPGNHDFDVSQANLKLLTRIAVFPTVSANLLGPGNQFPVNNKPYVILEKGGLRIGVIGIMSEDLYGLVNQNNLEGIRVLPAAETAQKYIDEISPNVDLVIALTHEGAQEDSVLATKVTGLQVIIGGHSHTRLRKPKTVNGVIIVQTGANCENLGVLDLTVDSRKVISADGKLLQLWEHYPAPVTPVSSLVDSMQSQIDKEYSEVIATLKDNWNRRAEGSIGSFITEAQRAAAHADVGFMNDGGIRKDVPAGPLTKRDLYEALPFRNILTTFQLSGKELLDVLRFDLERHPGIQIAGINCTWRKTGGGKFELTDVEVGGNPLDPDRMYSCAASDFFVGEAKKYLGLEVPKVIYLKQTVFEAVEQAVRQEKTIASKVLYRIEQEK